MSVCLSVCLCCVLFSFNNFYVTNGIQLGNMLDSSKNLFIQNKRQRERLMLVVALVRCDERQGASAVWHLFDVSDKHVH